MNKQPATIMAQCCPTRKAVDGVHCKWHVERTLTLVSEQRPAPERCPHCDAAWPTWHGDDLARHCIACGQLWERRLAVVGAP